MERLSSCYFCGDAVDASVAEYPLVDTDAHDVDTDHRIVLCSSCRRKLTNVIERVLSAAFNGESPPEPDAAMADIDDEMTATAVESVDEGDGDENVPADESGWGEAGTAENGGGANGEAATARDDDRSTAGDPADESDHGDAADTEAVGGASFRDDEVDDTVAEGPESSGAGTSGDESAAAQPSETDAGAGEAATADSDEEGNAASDGEAATTDAGEEGEATPAHGDYEKAEFNKIVRLLQNREFPVEIDELVVVASSAYEIDEQTCHAVIAALVDRGVVEDRGDELVQT